MDHIRSFIAVLLVRSIFLTCSLQSILPLSTIGSSVSVWKVVANTPEIPMTRRYPISIGNRDSSITFQNSLKQSPIPGRILRQNSYWTVRDTNADNLRRASMLAEEAAYDDAYDDDNDVDDDIDDDVDGDIDDVDDDNGDNDSINDDSRGNLNDDIVVVVPWDLKNEANDAYESLSSRATPKRSDGDVAANSDSDSLLASKRNRTIFWTCGIAIVVLATGFLLLRRHREHGRWREYRTHRILQEHVDAFDLSFRDEDEVELCEFESQR